MWSPTQLAVLSRSMEAARVWFATVRQNPVLCIEPILADGSMVVVARGIPSVK